MCFLFTLLCYYTIIMSFYGLFIHVQLFPSLEHEAVFFLKNYSKDGKVVYVKDLSSRLDDSMWPPDQTQMLFLKTY